MWPANFFLGHDDAVASSLDLRHGLTGCSGQHHPRESTPERFNLKVAVYLPHIVADRQFGPASSSISILSASIKFFTGTEVSFFNHTALI